MILILRHDFYLRKEETKEFIREEVAWDPSWGLEATALFLESVNGLLNVGRDTCGGSLE